MLNKSFSSETINHSFELPSFVSYAKDNKVLTSIKPELNKLTTIKPEKTNKNKLVIYASSNQDYHASNRFVYHQQYPIIYPTNCNLSSYPLNNEINELVFKLLSLPNFKEIKSFLSNKKTFALFITQIDKMSPYDIQAIFTKLFQDIEQYMKDADLNTIIQKLILKLDSKQRMLFLDKVKVNLPSLACTYYSTYCIQAFIESSDSDQEQKVVLSMLEGSLFKISTNKQGIHVMTLMFKFFKKRTFLKKFVLPNMLPIAKTKYGIKFIKNIIDLIKLKKSSFKLLVLKEIELNILEYATNEYAHFLILHLFDSLEHCELRSIIRLIYDEKDKLNNKFFKRILSFIMQAKLIEGNEFSI